ncbi:alpha-amylase family glycosyl hydrolase [Hirschia baltica]|uniref:Alpha amylase catalytic region n=1 Tax=Hirschia baltica (strain ATCC 49814 / DSM 5838 / IFAM 1418) TaxID=582402 RepID=C6XNJ8_HIRBI|nr:alpha-amylase family glycosyl hydrolase [Hirschia baltica]ACT60142.1 alpha amylase catalytic region [Hirschia baltica ATCC 49814]
MIRAALILAFSVCAMACSDQTSGQEELQVTQDVAAPDYTPKPYVQIEHPEWTRDAVIYQINTRQFTPEGSFKAAQAQLPRLAQMGIDIVWLMPIHPIGEVERKGELGSPYAVKDYRAVNPEFGTLEDLKAFVDAAHALDMHVILDWVANHTAWDNHLVTEHPEWYERDLRGELEPTPWVNWSDIIDLDYSQAGLRKYMTDSMRYWVEDVGVDGFRADVAGLVPLDFWETVRTELDKIKPVFMLAEYEQRDVHAKAFDATYAWGWKETMQKIAHGDADASAFEWYYFENQGLWPDDAYRMLYTSNHDQNSWDEAAPIMYGDAYENAIVLSFLSEGIPLIYNGQEAFNERMLAFFERDPIAWQAHEIANLFKRLIDLKTEQTALHNGKSGARMVGLRHNNKSQIFAFIRRNEASRVIGIFNMSAEAAKVEIEDAIMPGLYKDAFSGEFVEVANGQEWSLEPWRNRVLIGVEMQ